MATAETRERILDAAERLFAASGFGQTSLRTVTTEADVNLAAVHYHFGSKEALIRAVFSRRLDPLNAERLRLLDELEGAAGEGGSVAVADIVASLVRPAVVLAEDGSGQRPVTMLMLGRLHSETGRELREIVYEQFEEVRRRYLRALSLSLPELGEEELVTRFHFVVGTMASSFADPDRLDYLSQGKVDCHDYDALVARMIAFLTAALSAPPATAGKTTNGPRRARARASVSKHLLVLIAAAMLVGCVKAPPRLQPEPEFPVPAAYGEARDEPAAALSPDWWTAFDDDTLAALITEALAHNYEAREAAARVDQALALARIEGADLYPALGVNLDYIRQKRLFIGFPVAGGTTSSQWGASLDVSWEIDLWGRLRNRKGAALAEVQSAAADEDAIRLSVAAQVAKAWFALLEARDQLALAEQTERSYSSTAEQVRARYERGVRPPLDLRLALTERADAGAVVEARREQLDRAVRQLEVLLGRYPAAAIDSDSALPSVAGTVATGVPPALLVRRPDLVAAERRLAAAGARVKEARAALFPRLSAVGSRGRLGEDIEDLLEFDLGVWSVAANLTQPLFEGGRLRGQVELERARRREVLAQYFRSMLEAYREVESLLAAEHYIAARERELNERAHQAEAARGLAEQRYFAGLDDYITLLASQRASFTAESERIAVRRERLVTRVDLYLAAGGGFDADRVDDVLTTDRESTPGPREVNPS